MSRRILAVFLAIVLAVLGTSAVLYYVNRADDRAVDDVSAIEVLVAQQRISTGTTGAVIRDRKLAVTTRMPAASLPEGAVAAITPELEKQLVTSTLQPGQLLLSSMFANATETSSGLAIPSDKVAVSFEASMAQQVAGYVRPGANVALFASYTATAGGSRKTIGGDGVRGTAVLLPRIEVIAVGQYGTGETTITPQDGAAESEPTTLVTVAASTVEAAKIITAANAGAIYLALLTDESDVQAGVGVDNNNVFG
jgi:pilus assembly protein CpaB